MSKQDAIEQTLLMIKKSNVMQIESDGIANNIEPDDWHTRYSWLPKLEKDQFLIDVDNALFCILEPTWWVTQKIEYESFKMNVTDIYYSGEYEKREILRNSIVWVADLNTKDIIYDEILGRVHATVIEKLWEELYPKLRISSSEASELYNASISYFSNDVKTIPIHPIIIEVDMMLRFGSMSRNDIKNITTTDMERIKIVLMARSEVLGRRQ